LQIVNRDQGACAPDTRRAVQHDLILGAIAFVEFLNGLEDVVDYHVVLFFRGAVVWPRQVLQVRDRASIANQEFPFDQIRHY